MKSGNVLQKTTGSNSHLIADDQWPDQDLSQEGHPEFLETKTQGLNCKPAIEGDIHKWDGRDTYVLM